MGKDNARLNVRLSGEVELDVCFKGKKVGVLTYDLSDDIDLEEEFFSEHQNVSNVFNVTSDDPERYAKRIGKKLRNK